MGYNLSRTMIQIKASAKHFFRRHYFLFRIYHECRFRFLKLKCRGLPIIVYSIGKTGTRTVYESLESLKLDAPAYHIHRLSEKGIKIAETKKYIINDPTPKSDKRILASKYLRRKILQGPQSKKWRVITLVREPVARNISAFFQEIDLWAPGMLERYERGENIIDSLIDAFFSAYDHELILNWLDIELKYVFGIDVFAHSFPIQQGYEIYQNKLSSILLIRLEDLNACAEEAFKAFLGLERFSLVISNLSKEKEYRGLYKGFTNRIKFPHGYLDHMYSSKFARHFYSNHEIDQFRCKWQNIAY